MPIIPGKRAKRAHRRYYSLLLKSLIATLQGKPEGSQNSSSWVPQQVPNIYIWVSCSSSSEDQRTMRTKCSAEQNLQTTAQKMYRVFASQGAHLALGLYGKVKRCTSLLPTYFLHIEIFNYQHYYIHCLQTRSNYTHYQYS